MEWSSCFPTPPEEPGGQGWEEGWSLQPCNPATILATLLAGDLYSEPTTDYAEWFKQNPAASHIPPHNTATFQRVLLL